MATPKPTARNIRQGQTLYIVQQHHDFDLTPFVRAVRVQSDRAAMPPGVSMADGYPRHYLREYLTLHGNPGFHFSRRKAVSEMKQTQRVINARKGV